MAWKRIDSIAKRVIDRLECDTGKGVGALEPGGKVARPKPGQVNREEHQTKVRTVTVENWLTIVPPTIGRDRRTGELPQLMRGCPTPLVRRSMLTIITGGRQTHSGGAWEGPAGHNALAGGAARRVLLKLVAN